jgi:hypothetical protein
VSECWYAETLLNVKLVEPPLLRFTDSFPLNYAITAFVGLGGNWPRRSAVGDYAPAPRFLWLDRWSGHGLHHGAAVRFGGQPQGQGLTVINLMIGLCIAGLPSSVLSRTVVDAKRSWQQP